MKIKHFYQEINGWFDFSHVYDMAVKMAQDGDILVESGTANGKSIAYLSVEMLNAGKDVKLITIDNSTNEHQVKYVNEMLERMPNVEYKNEDTLEVAKTFEDGSCTMIYLDSCHDYEFVCKELRAWYPKLKKGGLFAGHDWDNGFPGVVQAVTEFVQEFGGTVIDAKNTWIYKK